MKVVNISPLFSLHHQKGFTAATIRGVTAATRRGVTAATRRGLQMPLEGVISATRRGRSRHQKVVRSATRRGSQTPPEGVTAATRRGSQTPPERVTAATRRGSQPGPVCHWFSIPPWPYIPLFVVFVLTILIFGCDGIKNNTGSCFLSKKPTDCNPFGHNGFQICIVGHS